MEKKWNRHLSKQPPNSNAVYTLATSLQQPGNQPEQLSNNIATP